MHTEDVPKPAARGERAVGPLHECRRASSMTGQSTEKNGVVTGTRSCKNAFSMTEMVAVIAIIGVLATIIVATFPDLSTSGRGVLANQRLEMLNGALSSMNISGRRIEAPANLASPADEQLIVMTLQMRDESLIGSPFVVPNYRPQASSDPSDFRLRYNGVRFELLMPGQLGAGLKVAFDGSDIGPARVFPPDFRPYGS